MNALFEDAVTLMLVGMGFVFVFLTLLVFATTFMSWAINKYFPEPKPVPVTPATAALPLAETPKEDDNIKAVISIAVAKFRARHKK